MISLPNVTLLAVDNVAPELMAAAIADCHLHAEFGRTILFTDRPDKENLVDTVNIVHSSPKNMTDATMEYWTGADRVVTTSHFLVIQWDSWIINPDCWDPDFLQYDYVGAPWWYKDGFNVGNGGFSLRSMALVDAVLDEPAIIAAIRSGAPEDDLIGRRFRKLLEREHGIRFAPEDVAYQFSRERTGWERLGGSFGFHGIFNWDTVLDAPALVRRQSLINDYVRSRPEYRELSWVPEHA